MLFDGAATIKSQYYIWFVQFATHEFLKEKYMAAQNYT
jgi:hypothetical protein